MAQAVEKHALCTGNLEAPFVLHIPHSGLLLPEDFVYERSEEELQQDIHRIVDHHTDTLFAPILAHGGLRILNPLCRMYFDPERFEDPAQERMHALGMGVFYTHTTNQKRFRSDDSPARYQERIRALYHPYHRQLTQACQRQLDRFGHCFLIDGHSYPRARYPFECFPDDSRPEIDLGTDAVHTPAWMRTLAFNIFSDAGYSVAFDQPFRGTLVPTPLLGDTRLIALMLEVRRDVYLEYPAYEEGRLMINHSGFTRLHETLEELRRAILSHSI